MTLPRAGQLLTENTRPVIPIVAQRSTFHFFFILSERSYLGMRLLSSISKLSSPGPGLADVSCQAAAVSRDSKIAGKLTKLVLKKKVARPSINVMRAFSVRC
jgi:hypothetical protein